MTLFLAYGAPDPQTGQNPNWETFGYPGPTVAAAAGAEADRRRSCPRTAQTLEADVVRRRLRRPAARVIAGHARAGRAEGRRARGRPATSTSRTSSSSSCPPTRRCTGAAARRRPPTATSRSRRAPRSAAAPSINWTNCLRTYPWVREQWAREFGLEGVDGPDYDRHLDAVLERIGATDECQRPERPAAADEARAARRSGWDFRKIVRNADPRQLLVRVGRLHRLRRPVRVEELDRQDVAARRGRERRRGARAHARAERVLVENGRAAGVEATYDPRRRAAQVTVRAPQVVVACGALESPALLLRTRHRRPGGRRLPAPAPGASRCSASTARTAGVAGARRTPASSHEFENVEDGYGFLIEGAQYTTGHHRLGDALDERRRAQGADDHGSATARSSSRCMRDRGHGRVVVDANGEAVPVLRRRRTSSTSATCASRVDQIARLHEAAGAVQIASLAAGLPLWRLRRRPRARSSSARSACRCGAGGAKLFSAHQMGTCRMGTDPQTRVANPWGELHDTPGVWIGDGSAFPTPSGHQPDGLDHGPGAPHRRGDRGRREPARRGRRPADRS